MKTFVVTHAKAIAPLTIKGKDLEDACIREGLDPAFWKEVGSPPIEEVEDLGDNQGASGPEDN